jgi:hypothetical protein
MRTLLIALAFILPVSAARAQLGVDNVARLVLVCGRHDDR